MMKYHIFTMKWEITKWIVKSKIDTNKRSGCFNSPVHHRPLNIIEFHTKNN